MSDVWSIKVNTKLLLTWFDLLTRSEIRLITFVLGDSCLHLNVIKCLMLMNDVINILNLSGIYIYILCILCVYLRVSCFYMHACFNTFLLFSNPYKVTYLDYDSLITLVKHDNHLFTFMCVICKFPNTPGEWNK